MSSPSWIWPVWIKYDQVLLPCDGFGFLLVDLFDAVQPFGRLASSSSLCAQVRSLSFWGKFPGTVFQISTCSLKVYFAMGSNFSGKLPKIHWADGNGPGKSLNSLAFPREFPENPSLQEVN